MSRTRAGRACHLLASLTFALLAAVVVPGTALAAKPKAKPLGIPSLLPSADPEIHIALEGETTRLDVSWKKVQDATSYRVEVARDPRFDDMVTSQDAPVSTTLRFSAPGLLPGRYHVRVIALGAAGAAGRPSPTKRIDLVRLRTEGGQVSGNEIRATGPVRLVLEGPQDTILSVDGKVTAAPVTIYEQGRHPLKVGPPGGKQLSRALTLIIEKPSGATAALSPPSPWQEPGATGDPLDRGGTKPPPTKPPPTKPPPAQAPAPPPKVEPPANATASKPQPPAGGLVPLEPLAPPREPVTPPASTVTPPAAGPALVERPPRFEVAASSSLGPEGEVALAPVIAYPTAGAGAPPLPVAFPFRGFGAEVRLQPDALASGGGLAGRATVAFQQGIGDGADVGFAISDRSLLTAATPEAQENFFSTTFSGRWTLPVKNIPGRLAVAVDDTFISGPSSQQLLLMRAVGLYGIRLGSLAASTSQGFGFGLSENGSVAYQGALQGWYVPLEWLAASAGLEWQVPFTPAVGFALGAALGARARFGAFELGAAAHFGLGNGSATWGLVGGSLTVALRR